MIEKWKDLLKRVWEWYLWTLTYTGEGFMTQLIMYGGFELVSPPVFSVIVEKKNKYINNIFWKKKASQIIIIDILIIKCIFSCKWNFISSPLIKIVCKCNQISRNEGQADFIRVSRKVDFFLIIIVVMLLLLILEKSWICCLGLPQTVPKPGWLTTKETILSQLWRLKIWNQGVNRVTLLLKSAEKSFLVSS